MKFKAYARNLTPEETETIRKMMSVVTDGPVEIIDLNSYGVENIDSNDILFLYGPRAVRGAEAHKCLARIEFPDISVLSSTFGDEGDKEIAYEKLLAFKRQLESGSQEQLTTVSVSEVAEDPWPEYSSEKVQALETSLRQKEVTEWKGTLEDGRTFRVTMKPSPKQADIDITFAELYAIKALKEVLRVKELEFVSNSNTISRKGGPQ